MVLEGCMDGVTRALAIGVASAAFGYVGAAALSARRRRLRLLAWSLAAACFFTPPLLVGYAYAHFTGIVRAAPGQQSLFYALLMFVRVVPVASVIWLMCPEPVSAEAWFCLRLLRPRLGPREGVTHAWRMWRLGALPAVLASFGVAFIMAFTEFELASFLGIKQWTVGILDAQVGGGALRVSFQRVALPASAAALVAGVIATILSRSRLVSPASTRDSSRGSKWPAAELGVCVFAAGMVLAMAIPAGLVLRGTLQDLLRAAKSFALYREIGASLLVSGVAGAAASLVARSAVSRVSIRSRGPSTRLGLVGVLLVPGLCGGLIIGLFALALLQLPLVWHLRETLLPLMGAAMLLVLPAALLIQLLLRIRRTAPDVHLARLLGVSASRRVRRWSDAITWVRRDRVAFWASSLLACQVFYDVTLSSLLAPVRMPLAMPRLYNFMHYGRSQILSASLFACVLAPPAAWALVAWVYRLGRSRRAATLDI
jgi:ABC-type Fe3+ transport system permease subunit